MALNVGGTLIIEFVIDKEGRVTMPSIRKALPAPTVSYATLEAARQWRFEPGRVDGEPVPVLYTFTFNFKKW